jgi:hypothetical protein
MFFDESLVSIARRARWLAELLASIGDDECVSASPTDLERLLLCMHQRDLQIGDLPQCLSKDADAKVSWENVFAGIGSVEHVWSRTGKTTSQQRACPVAGAQDDKAVIGRIAMSKAVRSELFSSFGFAHGCGTHIAHCFDD